MSSSPPAPIPYCLLFAIVMGEFLRFARQGSKLRRRDTAFGSRFVGRGYHQNDIFFSWLGSKNKREGQTGRRQSCRRVVVGRNISLFIGAQYKDGIIDRSHIPGRYKDFGDTGEGSHAKFTADVIGRLRLGRQGLSSRAEGNSGDVQRRRGGSPR